MDFLNGVAAQLRGLIESMSPGGRLLAGLLLAIAVISVGAVYQHGAATTEEALFSGETLPDSHLIRIEAAIAQAGLSNHRREGKRILVPSDQKSAYLAAIADADALPPNFNTLLEQALDNSNPLASREETRERLKIARQQTLSEIVRAMHWVEDAIVLYDEQVSSGLSGKKQVTCSVNVRPKAGQVLDARRTQALRTLVAHAVIGLRAEDIAVTDLGESASFVAPTNVVVATNHEHNHDQCDCEAATTSRGDEIKAWAGRHQDILVVVGLAISGLAVLWLVVPSSAGGSRRVQGSEFRIQESGEASFTRTTPETFPCQLQFDDLARLDDATLAALIEEVEPAVMALALAGSSDELMSRLTSQLPRDVAKSFRDQLLQLGPTRLSDVEAAQHAVASAAARLNSPPQTSHLAA